MSDEPQDADPRAPGLAIAAFVFGIVALLTSPLVVGSLAGAVGLGLSIAHLIRHRRPHALALWAVGLSVSGILASIAAGVFYYRHFQQFKRPLIGTTRNHHNGEEADWAQWRGRAAPPLVVTTIDGSTVDLASLRGRTVLVDFWATWCGPCVKEIPHLNTLAKERAEDLVVVAISEEDPSLVKAFAKGKPMGYHVVAGRSDDSLPEPFDSVRSLPTLFFIDATGVIRSVVSGYQEKDSLDARTWIAAAAERRAKGDEAEARKLAATALESQLDASTEDDLAAIFGGNPEYAALHDRVRTRVDGLIGHYEKKHDSSLGRDRATAVWVIFNLGAQDKDREAVPILVRTLRESAFAEARWRAADALWLIGDRRAVPDLIAALKDPVPMVAGFAASALGDFGDPAAVDPLLALFQQLPDNRGEAKARVADALGKLGDRRAIAPLSASLESIRDPAYVHWAEPALHRLEQAGGRF